MKRVCVLAVAIVLGGAAPAPAPVASYWMDVATQSGMGAGMSAAQIMGVMSGGAPPLMHSLDLRLASKTKPTAAPEADHWIPAGLQMGPSLPLVTPVREQAPPATPGTPMQYQRPKGRMLIYWGCGEHVGAGQPTVIDFAKIAAGQVPPGMAAMASMAHVVSGPTSAPGFGRWPNDRDPRPVPATGSLIGAHKVAGNYSPPIAFSLGSGQDFMPGLGLREAGMLPSGATRLMWQQAPTATGYALAMFGSGGNGDVVMWSSVNRAAMPALDYLPPAAVKKLVAGGAVLPPSVNECVLPAEVATASPAGMVTMIGYGPEADFTDNPKVPKWTAKVRFKTTASVIRGMGHYGAAEEPAATQPQPPPPRKRPSLGDILGGAIPIPH